MSDAKDPAQTLREINAQAAFNQWAAFEVLHADADGVVLGISWREEFGHYAGFLHAGMTAALIDTACGFAAVVATGSRVMASHLSVNYLRPAIGQRFTARARVLKPGPARSSRRANCSPTATTARSPSPAARRSSLPSVIGRQPPEQART